MTNHTNHSDRGPRSDRGLVAVILAAGKGTRMQSDLPKVMHPVMGRPMVHWVVDAARAAGATKVVLVIGHGADLVRDYFAGVKELAGQVEFALQEKQLGTGHAVMMAKPNLEAAPPAPTRSSSAATDRSSAPRRSPPCSTSTAATRPPPRSPPA